MHKQCLISALSEERFAFYENHVNPYWFSLQQSLGGSSVDYIHAQGHWLTDQQGLQWLDLAGSYGASVLGHHFPSLVDKLVDSLRSGRPAVAPFGISEQKGRLALELERLTELPSSHCHFFTTGAEAVEGAIKLARSFTGRRKILARSKAYHGMSLGTLPLTNHEPWKASGEAVGIDRSGVDIAKSIDEMLDRITTGHYAMVLLEPIQGIGGGAFISGSQARQLKAACEQTRTLLVVDEIMTGGGRTGHFLAAQTLGWRIQPDLLLLSKTLTGGLIPFSVLMGRATVFKSFFGRPGWDRLHGSTYSGNEHAVAVALEALVQIKQALALATPGLSHFVKGLRELSDAFAEYLSISAYGALIFIVFHTADADASATDFFLKLYNHRVLTLPCAAGAGALKLLPALNMTEAEARHALEAMYSSLDALKDEMYGTK